MSEVKLTDAIKDLRESMGNISQVGFSVRLGKSLTMIQRYERGENIPARDLAVMVQFSREAKRPDLAAVFKKAAFDVVGPEVIQLAREEEPSGSAAEKTTKDRPVDKRKLSA